MGLITEILSFVRGAGDADTAIGCETALSRLQSERAAATAAIASAGNRRRSLLLDDASDKQIAALDKEMDGHHLTLERLELIEGNLIDRLQALRSDQRREQFKKTLKRYFAASTDYVAAHRAAVRSLGAVTAIVDEARAGGFEHEMMAHHALPPQLLSMAQIAVYESEVERISEAASGRAPVMPAQPVRHPFVDQTPFEPASARAVRRGDVQPPRVDPGAPRSVQPQRVDVANDGERLVRVMRKGYEAPDGQQCQSGDVIALRSELASAVVKNGAAEFFEDVGRRSAEARR